MNHADLIRLMPTLAERFLGEPNRRLCRPGELRFGTNGSVSVDVKRGIWKDFESGAGGGVLDLVKHWQLFATDAEAMEWVEREYGNDLGRKTNGGPRTGGPRAAPSPPPPPDDKQVLVGTFQYHDRDGALSFVVERFEFQKPDGSFVLKENGKHRKTFKQKQPDPNRPGQWIYNVQGCPVLPYRLPEVMEAIAAGHRILVFEGEGKVDLAWSWNVPATCNAGGAGKWTKEHAEYLREADVVVLGDADDAGRSHVRVVGTSLKDIAKSVCVLDLPGLGPKEDIRDWAAE